MVDKIRYKVIFWDFDGVLMDSNAIRNAGFEMVLKDYPKAQVSKLLEFHNENGGLSRYVKFRYFFEEVRGEQITDEDVNKWAGRFSQIMLENLMNPDLLIQDTISYVIKFYKEHDMHIVSGSDGNELKEICNSTQIAKYFNTINGSPTPKTDLVSEIVKSNTYNPEDCVLIGDSINDYDAAKANGIKFIAYNNKKINHLSDLSYNF